MKTIYIHTFVIKRTHTYITIDQDTCKILRKIDNTLQNIMLFLNKWL